MKRFEPSSQTGNAVVSWDADVPAYTGTPTAPGRRYRIASLTQPDGVPRPVVASLGMGQPNPLAGAEFVSGFAAGIGFSGVTTNTYSFSARWNLQYGSGVMKTRYIDALDGTYQLPPCVSANVYLDVWKFAAASALPAAFTVQGEGALVTGTVPWPSEPRHTLIVEDPSAGDAVVANAARGARYWTAGVSDPAGVIKNYDPDAGPWDSVYVNSATRVRFPPAPRWDMGSNASIVGVEVDAMSAPANGYAYVAQFLEL